MARRSCCSRPSCRRSSSPATASWCSSAATSSTRCPPPKPTSRPCFVRPMGCLPKPTSNERRSGDHRRGRGAPDGRHAFRPGRETLWLDGRGVRAFRGSDGDHDHHQARLRGVRVEHTHPGGATARVCGGGADHGRPQRRHRSLGRPSDGAGKRARSACDARPRPQLLAGCCTDRPARGHAGRGAERRHHRPDSRPGHRRDVGHVLYLGRAGFAGAGQTHTGDPARCPEPGPGLGAVAVGAQRPASAPGGSAGLDPVAPQPRGAGHPPQLRPDDPALSERHPCHARRTTRRDEAGMSTRAATTVRLVQQHSILVLIALLVALACLIEIIRPGAVNATWVSNILEFAAPLGILAAGQTLVVITGGIDLSVANVATAAAYIMATQAPYGVTRAIVAGLLVGVVVGLVNGVGVAVFRVQPLIMTLAMGLVVTGSLNVYSQAAIRSVPGVPAVVHALGSGTVLGYVPVSLFLWAPLAVLLILGLRGTGFGRLLYALGDNLEATRLAGVRGWQVLLANYAACGFLSAVAGLVLAG